MITKRWSTISIIFTVLILLGLATTLIQTSTKITSLNPELNTKSNLVETENQSSPVKIDSYKKEFSLDLTTLEVIAEQLNIPWAITFLPDDSLLITERPGNLLRLFPENHTSIQIKGVAHVGEGGLLGITLHPDYEENHWLYLYQTQYSNNQLVNLVYRYKYDEINNQLTDEQIILDEIPAAIYHDGGRIAFGPDQKLYISTGDANQPNLAQDINSLAGKILRVNDDGSIPTDNPFENAVYSYGHRNVQGISWDSQGQLWSSEHGPSGLQTGYDEINLIQKGGNYGWPEIKGDQTQANMISPIIHSGNKETWAPGDLLAIDSKLIFPGLKGQSLYILDTIEPSHANISKLLTDQFGRLRTTAVSHDQNWLYLATSNTDGRGKPSENDDRIFRIKIQ